MLWHDLKLIPKTFQASLQWMLLKECDASGGLTGRQDDRATGRR